MSIKKIIIPLVFICVKAVGMELGHDSDDDSRKEEKPKLFRTFSSPLRKKPSDSKNKGSKKNTTALSIADFSPFAKKETQHTLSIEKKLISAFVKCDLELFRSINRNDDNVFDVEYVLAKLMTSVAKTNKQATLWKELIKKHKGRIDVNKELYKEKNKTLKEIAKKTECPDLIELMEGLGMAYYSAQGSISNKEEKGVEMDASGSASTDKDEV